MESHAIEVLLYFLNFQNGWVGFLSLSFWNSHSHCLSYRLVHTNSLFSIKCRWWVGRILFKIKKIKSSPSSNWIFLESPLYPSQVITLCWIFKLRKKSMLVKWWIAFRKNKKSAHEVACHKSCGWIIQLPQAYEF